MRRITWTVVLLVCALPALANAAWFFNTWAKSAGGTITSRNKVNQTSVDGSVYKSYTTSASLSAVITANTGYTIRDVTVNGVITTAPASPFTTWVKGPTQQTVYANFAPTLLSVTASASANGTVSPTSVSNIYYGTKLSTPMTFTFRPSSGYALMALSGATGATVSSPIPAPKDTQVTVTFPAGYIFTAPVNLVGTFGSSLPVADAGAPQTVLVNSLVTLTGSYSGGDGIVPASYTWTQYSGPAQVVLTPNGNKATFTPTVAGVYQFTLTLDSGSSALARVTVGTSLAGEARSQCQSCHETNNPAGAPVFFSWSSSRHKVKGVMCARCHVGADSGGHPGTVAGNVCENCHLNAEGRVPLHPFAIGSNACISCHNPHSTRGTNPNPASASHFNNVTSGTTYPASYITSRATCMDCHYDSSANTTIRFQWGGSGHAAVNGAPWAADDFKTKATCVQCHTTTGFIAYSTGKVTAAWGSSADKTKEILSCIGCHTDIIAGTVRSMTPVKPFADDPYQNRDVGESNICFACHSGTNNGASISGKVGSANFSNLPFVAPHNLAAAANLHGTSGYRFPGQTYQFYSSNSHRMVGMGKANTGNAGPCVACHMTSPQKHTYRVVETDPSGAITGISSSLCVNCHATSLDPFKLAAQRSDFLNALNALKAMLAAKGFVYSDQAPYFSNTDWGTEEAGANAMGAAYNYRLLATEPGAYAHNSAFAKKLISDSIDVLYNGRVTGSIDSALASLVSSGAITQQSADQVTSYNSAASGCTSCHDYTTTGNHSRHVSDSFTCADCHSSTASGYLASGGAHLNGQVDVSIASINNKSGGVNYTRSGNTCSGITCHGNGTQTVTWGGTVTCESCHSGTLSVINGVTANDRSLSASRGHGKSGIGYQCVSCHDVNKRHLGGGRMLLDRYTGELNVECNYCHNNTSLITDPLRNVMRTHIAKSGGISACTDCHDLHGTSNKSMIKTSILGQPITYTSDDQLIDPVTNMGFCQVCHTKTRYYQAGVPELNHDTSQCLACHDHKSPNGGFLNRPVKSCNSCHGFPPAPRVTPLQVRFGVMNNWSGARFERYSGGGGAHLVNAHVPKSASLADGWNACIMCHDPNYHRVDLFVENPPPVISHIAVNVQQQYRFSSGFTIYTGAKLVDPPLRNVTGSCFNISCHMSPSPPWSTER